MKYLIKSVVNRLSDWQSRRLSIRALGTLNHRLPRDIGISRSEIGTVIDGLITGR